MISNRLANGSWSEEFDSHDELCSILAALPSANQTPVGDESAVFDNAVEPQIGLIDSIRKSSICQSDDDLANKVSSNPAGTEDTTSFHSIEDDRTISASDSTTAGSVHTTDEADENSTNTLLKSKKRHLFILSENGKPVFSRYGDEDEFITLMGVMQTLVSLPEMTDSNQLNYLKAGNCRIAFLHKGPWISNAERKLLINIIDMYEQDFGMLISCAKCLGLPPAFRTQIGQVVAQIIRGQKDLIFAIILAHGHLVSIARLKNYHLHPSDLYLLINLIKSSDAFKGVESWVPVCLPRFDSDGCLHAHISYLDDTCDVCLLLLTVNPEHFQIMSDFKERITEKFKKINAINQIHAALDKDRAIKDEIACPELLYFAYKSRGLSQYTSTRLQIPYDTEEERLRLFQVMRYVHGRLHDPTHQLRIVFYSGERESVLGWLAPGFELHAVFLPTVTLDTVSSCIDRILLYIKKEETQIFIMRCEHI